MFVVIVMAALAGVSCAVPLGPGYSIERQRLEVVFVRAPQRRVDVRASWRVKNTGDRPLTSLDVEIPEAKTRGLSQLRIESGGTELRPSRAASARAVRVVLPEPLAVKAKWEFSVSYSLAGDAAADAGVVVDDRGFVLPPGDWAPAVLPPAGQGSFARGGGAPKKWEMTVRVPEGFRVYGSGRVRGEKKEADSIVFRFQQRRESGLPFAAGGAYQETRVATAGGDVILWTLEAMPKEPAEAAAEATARTERFYGAEFGERDAGSRIVRIIECPAKRDCWAVPGAALPGREIYTTEFWSSETRAVDRQLALSRLDFRVHPEWREEPYPMAALANYAADLAAIARAGGDARHRVVRDLLAEFDRAEKPGPEKAVLNVRLSDGEPARRSAELKSELFVFALEDAAGHEALHGALLHLLHSYEGRDWHAADLRSAVEQESGKDLAGVFRAWLAETGIPAEFRSRY